MQSNNKVYTLDGGVGTELERRGATMCPKTWCGLSARDNKDLLAKIHEDYINAGAQIIITNTFASSRLNIEDSGLNDEEIKDVNMSYMLTAKEVARKNAKPIAVAGSLSHMSPFGTNIVEVIQGSAPKNLCENRFCFAIQEMINFFSEAECDFIFLEMMNNPQRLTWVLNECAKTKLPIWCGFAARENDKGELLSYFQGHEIPFKELIEIAIKYEFIEAFGVMHTPAKIISRCLKLIKTYSNKPLYVYPESGHFVLPNWHFERLEAEVLSDYVKEWVKEGVFMIGGCCGTTPDDIKTIYETLKGFNPLHIYSSAE